MSDQSQASRLQDLSFALYKHRKDREAKGDMEGYIFGIQLANEYEDAFEKAAGPYPEKLEEVARLLAPDWVQRVEKFMGEKTELDDPKLPPIDRWFIREVGLTEYRKIVGPYGGKSKPGKEEKSND